jgi:hypothetical protein
MCQVAGSVVWISLIFQFSGLRQGLHMHHPSAGLQRRRARLRRGLHARCGPVLRRGDGGWPPAIPIQTFHTSPPNEERPAISCPIPPRTLRIRATPPPGCPLLPALHQLACTHAVPSPHSECSPAVLLSPHRLPARRGPGRASSVPSGCPPLSLRSSVARADDGESNSSDKAGDETDRTW